MVYVLGLIKYKKISKKIKCQNLFIFRNINLVKKIFNIQLKKRKRVDNPINNAGIKIKELI